MNDYYWRVMGTVGFETFLLTLFYLLVRSRPTAPLGSSFLIGMAFIMMMSMRHAFRYSNGVLLFVHVAFLAALFGLCLWQYHKRNKRKEPNQPLERTTGSDERFN